MPRLLCQPIRFLLAAAVLMLPALRLAASEPVGDYQFHHENVLGTWLELRITAPHPAAARAAESRALVEIDRLNQIFSTYTADSEFSRWQQTLDQPVHLSADLLEVLVASQRWRAQTSGAFNPAVESLSRLWQAAARRQQTPAAGELAGGIAVAAAEHWHVDRQQATATRLTSAPLNLNAIAKGYIVDRACRAAHDSADVTGVAVNLGGDLAVRGTLQQQVHITDPFQRAENASPIARVVLADQALATSGNYDRNLVVGHQRHSHVIDPRSGQPADQVASASVIARSAMDADALATAFCVLEPAESLRLASLSGVECLIVDRQGHQYHSAGWPREAIASASVALAPRLEAAHAHAPPSAAPVQSTAAPSSFELKIELEINRPEATRYERPYVAVWIEDGKNFPVRTLALWIKTAGSGPTWIPDLKRWFRGDLKRLVTDKTDLVVTRSSVTRPPGKHELVWDGKDNLNKPLPQGNYTVMIEAAREHGTYQIIRKPVTLGDEPFAVAVDGNLEIKSARLEYRPAKPAP